MIIVKNKLKTKHTTDDDEYLSYLKYSHLNKPDQICYSLYGDDDDDDFKVTANKGTQYPDIRNNQTQTDRIATADKATDPKDELDELIGRYILKMSSDNYNSLQPSRKEKMTQVAIQMIQGTDPKTPPSSSSGSSKSTPRALRYAIIATQMTGHMALGALNFAQTVTNIIVGHLIDTIT